MFKFIFFYKKCSFFDFLIPSSVIRSSNLTIVVTSLLILFNEFHCNMLGKKNAKEVKFYEQHCRKKMILK